MGVIESINIPYGEIKSPGGSETSSMVMKMLDEILTQYAVLIADVEDRKIDANFLKNEIGKHVDRQKGIYQPEQMKQLIFDTLYGYGPLQVYIRDEAISDIDAPRYDFVTIKRNGKIERIQSVFTDERSFERFCRLLIIRHGGLINEVDNHCRVSDKANRLRINVSIPPRNAIGASLNIRKHAETSYNFDDLIHLQMIDAKSRLLIERLNHLRKNVLICGKGASGKTTLLRAIINHGDEMERVLICESDMELYPQKKNTIVQTIKKRQFGGKVVSLSDLINEGLTMSLDTYCIGEIIGEEAWAFVKAAYTDHRVMGTIHARSAEDAITRMSLLLESETKLSSDQLIKMIAKHIQYIIYLKNFKVASITEMIDYQEVTSNFVYKTLYERKEADENLVNPH